RLYFPPPPTTTLALYCLSLHDALPILLTVSYRTPQSVMDLANRYLHRHFPQLELVESVRQGGTDPQLDTFASETETKVSNCGSVDRKSTRLNSSHVSISYAVFCLRKKK